MITAEFRTLVVIVGTVGESIADVALRNAETIAAREELICRTFSRVFGLNGNVRGLSHGLRAVQGLARVPTGVVGVQVLQSDRHVVCLMQNMNSGLNRRWSDWKGQPYWESERKVQTNRISRLFAISSLNSSIDLRQNLFTFWHRLEWVCSWRSECRQLWRMAFLMASSEADSEGSLLWHKQRKRKKENVNAFVRWQRQYDNVVQRDQTNDQANLIAHRCSHFDYHRSNLRCNQRSKWAISAQRVGTLCSLIKRFKPFIRSDPNLQNVISYLTKGFPINKTIDSRNIWANILVLFQLSCISIPWGERHVFMENRAQIRAEYEQGVGVNVSIRAILATPYPPLTFGKFSAFLEPLIYI